MSTVSSHPPDRGVSPSPAGEYGDSGGVATTGSPEEGIGHQPSATEGGVISDRSLTGRGSV
jgi:hypothetical protein